METFDQKELREDPKTGHSPEEQLSDLFGSYRAEWLKEKLFDLYTEPTYFPELTTSRPCILIGGRGTGKTTVLRCLSYEGQFALNKRKVDSITKFGYYGFYYRVNTNRVTAFKGADLPESKWVKLFAHYFNLVLCDLVVRFIEWYNLKVVGPVELPISECTSIAKSLHLGDARSIRELGHKITDSLVEFEAFINNTLEDNNPPLSLQGQPVDILMQYVGSQPAFQGKDFFFLLDEYENFEEYQQQVVNTLIKHSGSLYTFKVAVKELGWRKRNTLNENEQLISPADYSRIRIEDKLSTDFEDFALRVSNERVTKVEFQDEPPIKDVAELLPGLSEEEEAKMLGINLIANSIRRELISSIPAQQAERLSLLTDSEVYFLKYWAGGQGEMLSDTWNDYLKDDQKWKTRFSNNSHALLYTIRQGKAGIHKYYCGWHVFAQLAACNIRYLLELVDQSLLLHRRSGEKFSSPVSPKIQTEAAQYVGKKNLSEMEGLTVYGGRLTKLLLGLGRIFQTMAALPAGHAPEVNQFEIVGENVSKDVAVAGTGQEDIDEVIKSAIMHLALIRSPGNKLVDETDTREYDYMIHPIFCAFFEFSYRKKRKMQLSPAEVLGLITSPKQTIRDILKRNNRGSDAPLPEQLKLFETYYEDNPG